MAIQISRKAKHPTTRMRRVVPARNAAEPSRESSDDSESSHDPESSEESALGDDEEDEDEHQDVQEGDRAHVAENDESDASNGDQEEGQEEEDPYDQPFRPCSPYFYFCNSIRADVLAANPGAGAIEIARILADRWRALPKTDRRPFIAQHKQAEAEFERIQRDYGRRR